MLHWVYFFCASHVRVFTLKRRVNLSALMVTLYISHGVNIYIFHHTLPNDEHWVNKGEQRNLMQEKRTKSG
jgi:hypothetical protein